MVEDAEVEDVSSLPPDGEGMEEIGHGGSAGRPDAHVAVDSAGQEQCLNGVDDDGDDLADCNDPDCVADVICAPMVPVGWDGYFAYREQDASEPTQECAPLVAPENFFSHPSEAICEPACECRAAKGSCGFLPIACATNDNCKDATPQPQFMDGQCHDVPNDQISGDYSCFVQRLVANEVMCDVPKQPELKDARTWQISFDVCHAQPAGSACANGNTCVSAPKAPYEYGVCIRSTGERECPEGWNAKPPIVVYARGLDDRACDQCVCLPPAELPCENGGYRFWDDDGCDTCTLCEGSEWAGADSCKNTGSLADSDTLSLKGEMSTPANIPCTASGGACAGTVQPQDPMTFCCM